MALEPGEECFLCFRRGFTEYTRRGGLEEHHLTSYLDSIHARLLKGVTPPAAGAEAWAALRRDSLAGNDIYADEKSFFTQEMLSVYNTLRDSFATGEDPAFSALAAATWCNLLDVGQGHPLPEKEQLLDLFSKPLAADERRSFLNDLSKAGTLLILGDNAGETVMDRLFLELSGFQGRRYYMTRQWPVMNDAVPADAREAGLHREAELIPSGTDLPSVIPDLLSGKALQVFREADVIMAKGQGNLEGLFGLNDPRIYHSFVVKCPVIARATGIDCGGGVFRRFTAGEE